MGRAKQGMQPSELQTDEIAARFAIVGGPEK
jgi:hypothetical protein